MLAPLPGRVEAGWAAGVLLRATWGCPRGPRFFPPLLCSPQSRLGLWLLSDLFAPMQQESGTASGLSPRRGGGVAQKPPCPHLTKSQARKMGLRLEQLCGWGGCASQRPTGCREEQNTPEQAEDHLVMRREVGDAGQAVSNTSPLHDHKGVLLKHIECVCWAESVKNPKCF